LSAAASAGDIDAAISLFAPDAVFEMRETFGVFEGRAAVRGLCRGLQTYVVHAASRSGAEHGSACRKIGHVGSKRHPHLGQQHDGNQSGCGNATLTVKITSP
jgi:hypothetical protein